MTHGRERPCVDVRVAAVVPVAAYRVRPPFAPVRDIQRRDEAGRVAVVGPYAGKPTHVQRLAGADGQPEI
jgi:hypothetical protein